jgi:hypothetical protein
MITAKIPYDFIRQRIAPSWRDIEYALNKQFVSPAVAVEMAKSLPRASRDDSSVVGALADRRPDDAVLNLVQSLASSEPPVLESTLRDRWLYLVLSWLYE